MWTLEEILEALERGDFSPSSPDKFSQD